MVRFLTDHAHETIVNEFLVSPRYQKAGIGKAMLLKLQQIQEHTDIYIPTTIENESFFLKNGMKKQNHLKQVSRKKC